MTRTVAVVGLGQMGRSALGILLDRLPDTQFVALDRSEEAVRHAESLAPERVTGRIADVSKGEVDLTGVDAVVNLTGPFFAGSDAVARAALAAGAAYVDICDDVEGTEAILALDDEAKRAGLPLITGAGLSPGVSNWMASRLLDAHPTADGVQVVWLVHESDPGGLAPLRHMLHMAVSTCPVYRDGKWEQSAGFVPSTAASYAFPEPYGVIEAYDTAHPEPVTLSRHYPQLTYASCKGTLRPAWANAAFSTLGRIGFGHTDVTVDIDGTQVEPAEFLWKLMWARYNRKPDEQPSASSAVLVQALAGQEVLGSLAITDDAPMSRTTGLGAAVAAVVLLDHGALPGAWGPEALRWDVALPLYEDILVSLAGEGSRITRVQPTPAA
ncbi:saccharopine dehydrogenase NADP-binding domain-containing protein [Streptomyces prunicolor]|uniref:saccharopine dehydrogenase family protein n=1 Tax=Streptomyces prunicolor TaxID=67348 RepID=UPI002257F2A7|nr:saccharopine dehydrogenase NADP-binding domain-containing protein [Streptomyces prunicolor]MCX5240409.1 saccharopine dehydrogenase NADP-binding domain-containing protein [Streptomyces prunicolor]